MRKKILYFTLSVLSLASCRGPLDTDATFSLSVNSPKEYERPVVTVKRTGASGTYFPCQVTVDGQPVTAINAAGTTLLNLTTQDISLPRLAPGHHEIGLVIGKGRRFYRDAEAARGETDQTLTIPVEVEASPKAVIVLTFDKTDVDRYVFIPEDRYALDCNTGKTMDYDRFTILQDTYTVGVYPFSAQTEGFSVSAVGESLDVKEVDTSIGKGISVVAVGKIESGKASSRFVLSGAGVNLVVPVAG